MRVCELGYLVFPHFLFCLGEKCRILGLIYSSSKSVLQEMTPQMQSVEAESV